MGGLFGEVEDPEPMASEHVLDRFEGQIREVLVVDRVELDLFEQVEHVGELDGRDSLGLEHEADALDEVVEVGHVGQHVVADHEIGSHPVGDDLVRRVHAEELRDGGDADLPGRLGHVLGGLDAEHRHALGHEVLQEVPVVGRDLDHLRARTEAEAVDHGVGQVSGVFDPGLGPRREVRVVLEQVDRVGVVLDLGQSAVGAHHDGEREERGQGSALVRPGQVVGERTEPEIDHHLLEVASARTTLLHARLLPPERAMRPDSTADTASAATSVHARRVFVNPSLGANGRTGGEACQPGSRGRLVRSRWTRRRVASAGSGIRGSGTTRRSRRW